MASVTTTAVEVERAQVALLAARRRVLEEERVAQFEIAIDEYQEDWLCDVP